MKIKFNSKADCGKFLHHFMSQNIRNEKGQIPRYEFLPDLWHKDSLQKWKTLRTSPLLKCSNLNAQYAVDFADFIKTKTNIIPKSVDMRYHRDRLVAFAYVEMECAQDADTVIDRLQMMPFHKQKVFISRIKPPPNAPPRREYLEKYEYITKMVIYNLPLEICTEMKSIKKLCKQQVGEQNAVRKVIVNYQGGGYPRRSASIHLKSHADAVKLYHKLHEYQMGDDVLTTGFISDYPQSNVLGITGIPAHNKRPRCIDIYDFVKKAVDERPVSIRTLCNGEHGWIVLVIFKGHQQVAQCMAKLARKLFAGNKVTLYELKRIPFAKKKQEIWICDLSEDVKEKVIQKHLLRHANLHENRIERIRIVKSGQAKVADAVITIKSSNDIGSVVDKVCLTKLQKKTCWAQIRLGVDDLRPERLSRRRFPFQIKRKEKIKEVKRVQREEKERIKREKMKAWERRNGDRKKPENTGGWTTVPVKSDQIKVLKKVGSVSLTNKGKSQKFGNSKSGKRKLRHRNQKKLRRKQQAKAEST